MLLANLHVGNTIRHVHHVRRVRRVRCACLYMVRWKHLPSGRFVV